MDAQEFTVAAGTSISKGDLLKISGDLTAAHSSANSDIYAGVASVDKDGTDSSTKLGLYVPGQGNRFDMVCGGAGVTLGALVSISGANVIKDATAAEILSGDVIGKAFEAGSAAEVIVVYS